MSKMVSVRGHARVEAFRRVMSLARDGGSIERLEERLLDVLAFLVHANRVADGEDKALQYLQRLHERLDEHTRNMPLMLREAAGDAERKSS